MNVSGIVGGDVHVSELRHVELDELENVDGDVQEIEERELRFGEIFMRATHHGTERSRRQKRGLHSG